MAYSTSIDSASSIEPRTQSGPHHLLLNPLLLTLVLCTVAAVSVEDDAFCCEESACMSNWVRILWWFFLLLKVASNQLQHVRFVLQDYAFSC